MGQGLPIQPKQEAYLPVEHAHLPAHAAAAKPAQAYGRRRPALALDADTQHAAVKKHVSLPLWRNLSLSASHPWRIE